MTVERSVIVPLAPDAAFALFSERIDGWWPPERRHLSGSASTIALSAARFFERDATGREVELGAVRSWEPPHRIVLDWYPGTGPDHPTEVEILFLPVATMTRVEVRHRAGPRSEDLFPLRAPRYATSWELVLASLAAAATG